jgi:peptidoglycan/xylan/chitin deacetylase (PgdA/CDA1 family)
MINGMNTSGLKVINFHEIEAGDVQSIENLLYYLKTKKNLVGAQDLLAFMKGELELPSNSFVLTVDDGHASFYKRLFPILVKLNVPCALFVSPKVIAEETNYWFQEIRGFDSFNLRKIISERIDVPVSFLETLWTNSIFKAMTAREIADVIEAYYDRFEDEKRKDFQNVTQEQLIRMHDSGLVAIGAHTMSHPILHNEDDESSQYEILESVRGLKKILGSEIDFFAYPNGIPNLDYSKREVDILKNSNVKLAFSTRFSKVKKSDPIFEIPRGEITFGRIDFRPKLVLWEKWRKINDLRMGTKMVNDRLKLLDRRKIAKLI